MKKDGITPCEAGKCMTLNFQHQLYAGMVLQENKCVIYFVVQQMEINAFYKESYELVCDCFSLCFCHRLDYDRFRDTNLAP